MARNSYPGCSIVGVSGNPRHFFGPLFSLSIISLSFTILSAIAWWLLGIIGLLLVFPFHISFLILGPYNYAFFGSSLLPGLNESMVFSTKTKCLVNYENKERLET